MEVVIKESRLRRFSEDVLQKGGLSPEDAFTVTDSLLFASLRGIDSHGISRLPYYIRRLEKGGTNARPQIKIIRERAASALIDGDDGMGQVVSAFALKVAIEKARRQGAAFVGVLKSCHNGAVSYYSLKIAEAGMIGISISNVTPVMAAWGGRGSVIGNNPLSIAAPRKHGYPLVLDIAMSGVAGGKVRLAAKNQQKIPLGWIVDAAGRPTDDPQQLTSGGALVPFGEHKGFALGVMLEVLAGALTGSGMLGQIPFWMANMESSLNIGHAFFAVDIVALMDLEEFYRRVDWIVDSLKGSPVGEDSPGIFMPGEMEWEMEQKRRSDGIPVSPEVYRDLEELSSRYHVPLNSSS